MIKLLFNIALIVGVIYFASQLFTGGSKGKSKPIRQKATPKKGSDAELLVEDPQCGVYVPVSHALKGPGENWFCSPECLEAYKRKSA